MKRMNNLLTASRMGAVLSCPRKAFWRYERGLQPTQSSIALRFGSAWARAMEARAKGADGEQALVAAVPEGADLDELQVATLSGLLDGYYKHYADDGLFKSMHPEVEFRGTIKGSRTFETAGKLDGLGDLYDGRLAINENKTTSDSVAPESDYWLRLRFNTQLLQYVVAAREMGWDVSAIIYDVVRKPSIEPKQIPELDENGCKIVLDIEGNRVFKKPGVPRESGDKEKGYVVKVRVESPEEFSDRLFADTQARPEVYFARREVPILDSDIEEFEAQRLTISRILLNCRQLEKRVSKPERAWPRNVSEMSCRSCEFSNFCLQNISIDIENPPAGFKVEFNSELTPAPIA